MKGRVPELTSLGRGSENGRGGSEGRRVGGGHSIHRKQAWGMRRGGWGRNCSNPAQLGVFLRPGLLCPKGIYISRHPQRGKGDDLPPQVGAKAVGLGHTPSVWEPAWECGWHGRPQEAQSGEAWGRACPVPRRKPPTSLEGTAQPRLAVSLVVTDSPIAAFGGRFGAVTPDAQLISTALTVPGAELRGGGETQQPASSDLGEPSLSPPTAWNA